MGKRLKRSYLVTYSNGPREIEVVGQFARTLNALISTGDKGITSGEISQMGWGYRMSHYILVLRNKYHLDIEMRREEHGGGWHGRYFLHTLVRQLSDEEAA